MKLATAGQLPPRKILGDCYHCLQILFCDGPRSPLVSLTSGSEPYSASVQLYRRRVFRTSGWSAISAAGRFTTRVLRSARSNHASAIVSRRVLSTVFGLFFANVRQWTAKARYSLLLRMGQNPRRPRFASQYYTCGRVVPTPDSMPQYAGVCTGCD